jgi:hypothetical protein
MEEAILVAAKEGEGDKAAQFRNVVNDCLLNLHVFVSVAVY